jgi:hypothetical protein
LLGDLKKAGVFGFTFHIDTSQKRPEVKATTESELNELRLYYAKMLARAGGISCSFNATVSERTLHEVPSMVKWAQNHADIVHTVVFILYRSPSLNGDFDFFANGEKIEVDETYEETEWGGSTSLKAPDVVEKIREADPKYEPCAYLNGTANPDSFKWLLASRMVLNGEIVGYLSPKFMELLQTLSHVFTGTYLAYAEPKGIARGKLASFVGALIDREMRKGLSNLFVRMLTNPLNLFRSAYIQSLMVIQPVDFTMDGRQDMCDGCPDITVHNGKLVWSCRLEELNNFGSFVHTVPRRTQVRAIGEAGH